VSSELQDQDIVFTTYGTLSAEFNGSGHSPLLATKWLRVCLDEGHFVKNYRTKSSKAAGTLDTLRKWLISGTPIQNNLGEFWSLLNFLNLEPYVGNRNLFKHQIENPIKHGHPHGIKVREVITESSLCSNSSMSSCSAFKP
jgi:SNF2 family DNA or RNA helicase